MSRHRLKDEPDCEIIVGFDPPLRAFFGQRFDPSRPMDEDDLVDGWPGRRGLGIQPRIESAEEAEGELTRLSEWLAKNGLPAETTAFVRKTLLSEWEGAPDRGDSYFVRVLREASARLT